MSTGCVVVAAGSGVRLTAGAPKAFVPLAGRALLVHAAERIAASGVVDELVVVVPAERCQQALELVRPVARGLSVRVTAGADTRQGSVRAGLAVLSRSVDVVLVHDAARCLVPPALVASVVAAVRSGHPAVVPGLPVHDTVRRIHGDGARVVDRDALRTVQTPQGFAREELERAHAAASGPGASSQALSATDDASLVELLGFPVHLVLGAEEALKVTRPIDLVLAEVLLSTGAV